MLSAVYANLYSTMNLSVSQVSIYGKVCITLTSIDVIEILYQ